MQQAEGLPLLEVHTFGGLRLRLGGETIGGFASRKVEALVVYLAMNRRPQPREALADLLWDDRSQAQALSNLRTVLASLGKRLNPLLNITRYEVALHPQAPIWLDAAEFETRLAVLGRQRRVISPPAARGCEQALELYSGDFLQGFHLRGCREFEHWMVIEQERLRQLAIDGLHSLVDYCLLVGAYERGLPYSRRLLELNPLQESAYRQRMRLLAYTGRPAAALELFESCRRVLAEELGLAPSTETNQLAEEIHSGELPIPPTPELAFLDQAAQPPAFLHAGAERKLKPQPVFVGREPELALLERFLQIALGGRGQVVFLAGEAGRGKTALAQAFMRRAMRRHPGLLAVQGACDSFHGLGVPYLPFRDALAMLTGQVEDLWTAGAINQDHALVLWESLPAVLPVLFAKGPQLVPALLSGPALAARAGLAASPSADWWPALIDLLAQAGGKTDDFSQTHLFEQCAAFLQALAQITPLLIILEDLHWADLSSISLLYHLGMRLERSRILLVGTYRPVDVSLGRDGGPHPLARLLQEFKRRFGDIQIDLDQEPDDAGQAFVDALLDGEPNHYEPEFRRRLVELTGGHPMFIVEILRELQARHDIFQSSDSAWSARPYINWEILPARVEGVIETRIGRLEPDLKESLAAASVQGETFGLEVAALLLGEDAGRLAQRFSAELVREHRIIAESGVLTLPGGRLSRFRFRHHLFYKYLYRQMGEVERANLHGQVGAALEDLYREEAGEVAGQLARHFLEAGVTGKAAHYLEQAGMRAIEAYAYPEAIGFLTRALVLISAEQPARRFDILLSRARAYLELGAADLLAADQAELDNLAVQLEDDSRRLLLALLAAEQAERTADLKAGLRSVQEGLSLASLLRDVPGEASGYLRWARALWRRGEYEPAFNQVHQALSLSREAGLKAVEAESLRSLGLFGLQMQDYQAANQYYQQAWKMHREQADPLGQGYALIGLGMVSYDQEWDVMLARQRWDEAFSHFEASGHRRGQAIVAGLRAVLHADHGQFTAGETVARQALEISWEIGDRWVENRAYCLLSSLSLDRGETAQAIELAGKALALSESIGDLRRQTVDSTALGFAWLGAGALEEAGSAFRAALERRRQLERVRPLLAAVAGLAFVQFRQGDLQAAGLTLEPVLDEILHPATVYTSDERCTQPFLPFWLCFQVLQACRNPSAEVALSATRERLAQRADCLQDALLRRSFLEAIPIHRVILQAD